MKKIILLIGFLSLQITLLAQASLEINLIDGSNETVIGTVIRVQNKQIGYDQQFVSDLNGKIQIDGLSTSGQYTVALEDNNFYQTQSLTGITLISDKTKSVTLEVEDKSTALEAITISAAEYQSINTVDAEVASELSVREIQELPIEGRDITRVLFRLPNITQATGFFPEAPNVAINGANSLYTNYQIDGLDNNENFLGGQRFAMPVGFTQNITALTNNFSAEHGLTSNGIINLTSKSGTNDLSGEVFYITRPGPTIDAPSPFAQRDISGNQVRDGFQRHQVGFALGGPIVQDKTFFFINAEYTADLKDNLLTVPQLGINETIQGRNNFSYFSAKIDQIWSSRFRSSLRANVGFVNIERQGGGLEGGVTFPSAGNQQDRNSVNIALKNTYSGEKFFYEANYLYGRFHWNYATPENENSPNVTVLNDLDETIAVLGHPGFVFDELENTHVIQQKFTFYQGSHRIKAGLQVKSSNYELFGGGNPNGSYTVQLTDAQVAQIRPFGSALTAQNIPLNATVLNYGVELRPNSFEKRQNIYSIYIEDQWTITPKLNVSLGLRYDYDNLSEGGNSEGDFDNIAPRLSINYRLNEKSSIRAGYGIYYDKILYAIHSDALQFSSNSSDYLQQVQALVDLGILPQDTDLERVTNNGTIVASQQGIPYLQGASAASLQGQRESVFQNELRILNPNGYDNPHSHQFMIGYQHKLDEKTTFYVDVMHNRSYNLFRLRNLNAPAAFNPDPNNITVRTTTEADLTRPIPISSDANGTFAQLPNGTRLRGAARNIVMTETEGRSNYYALNATFNKEKGEDKYALRLMYTLSFLENNTEDINFRAEDSNDFAAEWGPSINDRTHLINGIVSYYPINNLSFTLAGLIQSGQPINRIPDATVFGTTDLNGDGRAFSDAYQGNSDRQPGEDRNSDRLPWAATFDLSTIYQIPLGSTHSLELSGQIFNLFNAENLTGYSNNATQSNQIQVGTTSSGVFVQRNAAPPRQFQFSLRYLF